MKPKVILFPVSSAKEKILRIVSTAKNHFENKERCIFFVQDEKAQSFVDDLLWKEPQEGFLPHSIEPSEKNDYLLITTQKHPFESIKFAFNLCPLPLLFTSFQTIYDFEDLSTSSKQLLSQKKYQAYKDAQYIIESY